MIPKIGFAGLGWIGRNRMEAVAQSGFGSISMLCDPSSQLIADVQLTQPDATVAVGFDALLESNVEAIVIASPSALHAEQAIAALERGKAVFCQKPLGRNAQETRRVIDAARAANRLLGVDLSYRFASAMLAVKQLVESGQLGSIYAVDLTFHNAYGPDKPWFYDPKLSGGGCVIDLGIHLVDLGLWTLQFPAVTDVSARLFSKGNASFDPNESVEDFATARFDLAGGATMQLACSWNLSAGQEAVIAANFYGTRGAASFHNVNGSFYDFVAEKWQGTNATRLVKPPDAWGGRAVVSWVERLGRDRHFDPSIEQLITVAEALDGVYAAARRWRDE
jgi:predicted dehydrogenase